MARVCSPVVYPGAGYRPDWTARLICGTVILLPLACWPQAGSAFAGPKTLLLTVADLALAAGWLTRKFRPSTASLGEWPALAWVTAVSISGLASATLGFHSLLVALLPVPVFWSIARGLVPLPSLARAVWLGTTCEAAIIVLQFCGLDPLRALGWQTELFPSPRMRVYGTLGNPDFVAAWCCGALPFCWREIAASRGRHAKQGLCWATAAIQIAAILATRSRVFAAVIPLQATLVARRSRRMKWLWLGALPLAAALLYLAPTRPLAATIQGRVYLARVTAGHWQTPPVGYGPGAFEDRFGAWQAEWLRAHRQERGSMRFAGAVDHAHNDYLEFLVEYGPAGVGVFLALAGWVAVRAWRGRAQPLAEVESAAAIGAVTLLAIAAVDFPLHRPAEWSLLWLFLAVLARCDARTQGA